MKCQVPFDIQGRQQLDINQCIWLSKERPGLKIGSCESVLEVAQGTRGDRLRSTQGGGGAGKGLRRSVQQCGVARSQEKEAFQSGMSDPVWMLPRSGPGHWGA